jgi:hypothetical protein
LNGIDADPVNAAKAVEAVPVPGLNMTTAKLAYGLLFLLGVWTLLNPYVLLLVPMIAIPYLYINGS